MELRDYFRSFTEDELTRGAELYFADEISELEIKESHENTWADIRGNWAERGRGGIFMRKCRLNLDLTSNLPESCSCECDEFGQSLYGCAHTAALLTGYMVKKEGEEVFVDSRLETLLKHMANVEDPFAPGVMKRTDDRLLSLLNENVEASLPEWRDNGSSGRVKELLGVECSLTGTDKGNVLIDLKMGSSRKYIVKDIYELLDAYKNQKLYTLGKDTIEPDGSFFDAYSRQIMDSLAALMDAKERGLYGGKLFLKGGGKLDRYIILSGRELDSFMELLSGHEVTINEMMGRRVDLSRKGVKGLIKKKTYGASLQIMPLEILCITGAWMYLLDDEGLFRIRVTSTKETRELISMFAWSEPVYIRESDIGRVLGRLIPLFNECGELIAKGLDVDSYAKENPEFEFRLDYTDEGILTCEPFAIYPGQDFRGHLFDTVTGKTVRNGEKEAVAAKLLQSIFDRMDPGSYILYTELDEDELFSFMKDNIPLLEKQGVVMSTEAIKRSRVSYLPKVNARVKVEGSGLMLSIKGDGISEFEMSEILGAYKKKKKYYRLKSGQFLSLENSEDKVWETLSEIYDNYGEKRPENIRLPLYRALYLKESLEKREDVELESTDEYAELIRKMDPSSVKELAVPRSLRKIIRPYQTEGYRWIKLLKNCGFGGILADDMGLGKTLQVLSFILSEKSDGKKGDELRTLVVCPASLVYNWKREIEMYTASLKVAVITGTMAEREMLIKSAKKAEVWITSYDLLKRDIALYEKIHFANEIIDEAQYIKNQNTQAAQSVRLVDSSFRVALTGTPIENHLGELWSIMDYLMPGFLYNYTGFQKNYEVPIVAANDETVRERLRRMVHPFILRRMKKQVLKELPEKMEETIVVSMEGEQKKLYDANAKRLRDKLEGVSQTEFRSGKMQFLAQLTQLRELCCDPSLIYEDYKGGSAKLETCMELVAQSINSGHKLLLFSQFTSMLDIICKRLTDEGIGYHRIDGSVSKEKRMQLVDSFANDDIPVFCISLKAGGTGLNLTAADIVIHYDPWWNQAAQDQATDRTHRIGQTKTVNVYELIAQGSVEEQIQKVKESKLRLAEDILTGGEISSASFDKDEMIKLLS